MARIRFLDLSVIDQNSYIDLLRNVLSTGQILLGPQVKEFEDKMCAYTGRKHCIGVSSGSDALFLALRALGISPGDEVITTSLSWIATANAISMTGARPVFVDIGDDYNISPTMIENAITEKTKCVLTVDFTGRLCDYKTIKAICKHHKLFLVEDGSQAFGSYDSDGRTCGSFGDISAISHNPMKVLRALGEAGSILTDDRDIYEKLACLRYAGTINRETCVIPSLNHRLDTFQAGILSQNLETFEERVIEQRLKNALTYDSLLKPPVATPPICSPGERQIYYTYSVRVPNREMLIEHLQREGIETRVQHPLPMPLHPAYIADDAAAARDLSIENAKRICKEILCLPVHEGIGTEEIADVSHHINMFYSSRVLV